MNETPVKPMGNFILTCRACGEQVVGSDSEELRAEGEDLHQKMRIHLLAKHVGEMPSFIQRCWWFLDSLWFESKEDPEKWVKHIHDLLDYAIKGGADERG